MRRTFVTIVGAAALVVLTASGTYGQGVIAQGAIAGVVKDTSGAVLPGVTVQAASPALIEKTREVVTDERGQYKIIDLRPGAYSVTFTLTGFSTVRREGIELGAAFTATVNAELPVGAIEDAITVSGDAPAVDVQSSLHQTVLKRDVLEALPTGRNVWAIGGLLPGATTTGPDVGGSRGMQYVGVQLHGSATRDSVFQIDGMNLNTPFGAGGETGLYYNNGMLQEVSYQTSALPAEVSVGGVLINMVAREGANSFHGDVFVAGSGKSLQSNNFSDDLRLKGMTARGKLDKLHDVNLSLGGPIAPDKLWFFTSYRHWSVNSFVANTFNPDRTQALDDNRIWDSVLHLTFQASQRNKIAVYHEQSYKWRGHRRDSATFVEPGASLVQVNDPWYATQIRWTSPVSRRLLMEAAVAIFHAGWSLRPQPTVLPTDVAKLDTVTGILTNAPINLRESMQQTRQYRASASYVTGSHAFKAGFQLAESPSRDDFFRNQDMVLRLQAGVPIAVDVYNTPVRVRTRLNANLGMYAQDSWTIGQMTVNAGVRYEHFQTSVQEQTAPAGRFVGERRFAAIPNVPKWKTVAPRLAAAYDLFGDGKTALKGSISKYYENEGLALADRVNPMFTTSDQRSWRDPNGDGIAQIEELGPSTGFRGGVNSRYDPKLSRPYQWEITTAIQREVLPRFSVSATYFRRAVRGLYGVKNVLVPPTDYTPVTITNPLSSQPLTVYNQSVATRSLVDLLVSNYDELNKTYNGFELQANKRFSNGGTVMGGFTVGRNRGSIRGANDDLNNPNVLINHVGMVDADATYQVRLAGSYPLPLQLGFSGSLRTNTGLPLRRVLSVTRTLVPNLTQVSQSVDVTSRGEVRLEKMTVLDLRVSRTMRVRGTTTEVAVDLFNALNANPIVSELETIGPSLGRPASILDARFVRFAATFKF